MGDFGFLAVVQATIGAGNSVSAPVELDRFGIMRIHLPGGWTTADLTFRVSEDGQTYADLYDSTGAEVTVTGTPGVAITLDPTIFGLGFRFLEIRSGTGLTPVNQVSAAAISLAVRPL